MDPKFRAKVGIFYCFVEDAGKDPHEPDWTWFNWHVTLSPFPDDEHSLEEGGAPTQAEAEEAVIEAVRRIRNEINRDLADIVWKKYIWHGKTTL